MTETIEDLFFYGVFAADLFVIIQILFFLKPFKRIKTIWFVLSICIFNSLFNIISLILPDKAHYFNNALFTIVEYAIFAAIFYRISVNEKYKKAIIFSSLIFLGIVIFNFNPSAKNFDSLPIGVETILIMIYCFYYLYEQMNDLSDSFIYNRYHFWIAIGILIYLGGSFFIYLFAEKAGSKILDDYWFLTYVFYIVKNVFFAIGIANLIAQNKKSKTFRIKPHSN